jgi:hypothetical protein
MDCMRLSLRRGAHAALSSAAWQEIRVRSGRDDNSFTTEEIFTSNSHWSIGESYLQQTLECWDLYLQEALECGDLYLQQNCHLDRSVA